MIASTSVARWTWGRDDETADALVCCLSDLLVAYQVLAAHRFAVDAPVPHVSVSEAGTSNSLLFEGEPPLPAHGLEAAAPQVAERVRKVMRAGDIGSVDAYVMCSGVVVTGPGAGQEERQDGLFRLGASSFADFVTVDLVTYTDVWLPYDLKGRPQPEAHRANGARLSAVLRELAEVLGSDTDPDDPTYFARPTATGAENFFAADGSAADVWGSFEVPTRYDVFTHAPGFGRIGYRRTAEGAVQYVPVIGEAGVTLGYLWASDAENAASFEPLDVGDDATYRAGLAWLDRLRTAHDRGLRPSTALTELSALDHTEGIGRVDTNVPPRTLPLPTLRASSGVTE